MKLLDSCRVPEEKSLQVLHMLVEGCSVRACERLAQVNRNTVLSILEIAGEKCQRLLDAKVRNIKAQNVELDEAWTYVMKKEWKAQNHPEYGDQYLYVSFCRDSKLIINHHVAKRCQTECDVFVMGIKERLASDAVQLSSDCWRCYGNRHGALVREFKATASYGTVFKQYGKASASNPFSPKRIEAFYQKPIWGNPTPSKICTSYVERQNLNFRLFNKRFSRQTICFSKKLKNL